METESAPSMLEFLNEMLDSGDPRARVLYKYRSCAAHNIESLRTRSVWFSSYQELNDPFDCLVRLPGELTVADFAEVRDLLREAVPYDLDPPDARAIAEYIGRAAELPPLIPLGLLATQLGRRDLRDAVRAIRADDDAWIAFISRAASATVGDLLRRITVFCLSERNDHQLMWAHYGASHTGFCAGYVCPVGIDNPRLIQKVSYSSHVPRITPRQVLDDPWSLFQDLTLTKPDDWSHEQEWRVQFGNARGLATDLLPCREIILGARIAVSDEHAIREAASSSPGVRFYRAVPHHKGGKFEIRIQGA